MERVQKRMDSKIGPLYLVASEKGLQGVFWREPSLPKVSQPGGAAGEIIEIAERQLNEYFAGSRQEFDIPLDTVGTEFQKKVWQQLAQIPYGETRSYLDIAKAVRNPKACQAVGTANGSNPLAIIVPCHRVINASGKLGGYAGGLEIKEKLLQLERRD